MNCSKLNDNQSILDLILNSPAPIYTSIMLRVKYSEQSEIQKDRSVDFLSIAEFCEVSFSILFYLVCRILHKNIFSFMNCDSLSYRKQPTRFWISLLRTAKKLSLIQLMLPSDLY